MLYDFLGIKRRRNFSSSGLIYKQSSVWQSSPEIVQEISSVNLRSRADRTAE
jgi:hypothetical protein